VKKLSIISSIIIFVFFVVMTPHASAAEYNVRDLLNMELDFMGTGLEMNYENVTPHEIISDMSDLLDIMCTYDIFPVTEKTRADDSIISSECISVTPTEYAIQEYKHTPNIGNENQSAMIVILFDKEIMNTCKVYTPNTSLPLTSEIKTEPCHRYNVPEKHGSLVFSDNGLWQSMSFDYYVGLVNPEWIPFKNEMVYEFKKITSLDSKTSNLISKFYEKQKIKAKNSVEEILHEKLFVPSQHGKYETFESSQRVTEKVNTDSEVQKHTESVARVVKAIPFDSTTKYHRASSYTPPTPSSYTPPTPSSYTPPTPIWEGKQSLPPAPKIPPNSYVPVYDEKKFIPPAPKIPQQSFMPRMDYQQFHQERQNYISSGSHQYYPPPPPYP
jgi:hypothetical protein